jgi:hypothetical protein
MKHKGVSCSSPLPLLAVTSVNIIQGYGDEDERKERMDVCSIHEYRI